MGMYTELIFGAGLKKDTPTDVIETINRLIAGGDCKDFDFPEHVFFSKPRRLMIVSGCSTSFPAHVPPTFRYDNTCQIWALQFRSNLKNYDGEIESFLDWIAPYIEKGSGNQDFYAIVMYEECDTPVIYYKVHCEEDDE
jgi:hypothetical protein